MTNKTTFFGFLILGCLLFFHTTFAQTKNWRDSIRISIKDIYRELRISVPETDSFVKSRLRIINYLDTTKLIEKNKPVIILPEIKTEKKFIHFNGGFISYDGIYRSAIDTPFKEDGIFQHLLSGKFSFTLSQSVPISLTYFQRESNSKYFKDYRDFRVELNVSEFQRLKAQKDQIYINGLLDQMRDPYTRTALDYINSELLVIDGLLNHSAVVNRRIGSRISVNTNGLSDTTGISKDSAVLEAKHFLSLYDSLTNQLDRIKGFRDSLQQAYVITEKQIHALKAVLTTGLPDNEEKRQIENILKAKGIDAKYVTKIIGTLGSIRKLALGRISPNYSDLTLKNVNLKGIDFEYNRNFYFSITAGWLDFRARDFLRAGSQRLPQFIYASRFGYGQNDGSHVYLTGFRGKKQLLSSISNSQVFEIYGLSFETQALINKNHRLTLEISQSVSPNLVKHNQGVEKSTFDLKDEKNKAYSFRLQSFFPQVNTKFEAFYQYRGVNYQSFTSYYSNASLYSWNLKVSQYLFKRKLHLLASALKNSFENPNLLTRYTGNSVLKNISLTFRNKKSPAFSFSYMPSSQLSDIDGVIYQNYFQTLTFSCNHSYNVGMAKAHTVISYNRFYNDSKDSGFIYFNANNLYINQTLQFLSYSATINMARSSNTTYTLTTLDGGINANVFKNSQVGLGVKIMQLNDKNLRVGLYGNERIIISKLGELNLSIEKTYLPGFYGNLVKNDLYTIGYRRFF